MHELARTLFGLFCDPDNESTITTLSTRRIPATPSVDSNMYSTMLSESYCMRWDVSVSCSNTSCTGSSRSPAAIPCLAVISSSHLLKQLHWLSIDWRIRFKRQKYLTDLLYLHKGKKVKVKRTCIAPFVKLQLKALRYGSHTVAPANYTIPASILWTFARWRHLNRSIWFSSLLIYRPRKDERLSWLTYRDVIPKLHHTCLIHTHPLQKNPLGLCVLPTLND